MSDIDENYVAFLANRRCELNQRIAEAARAVGRDPHSVRLVAVSKTVDVDAVRAAVAAGYTEFAENRPQELVRKTQELAQLDELSGTIWHMIGNLQTNKINKVLDASPALVHSVSSLDLAAALASRAEVRHMTQHCLIEVNVSGEASKSGVTPDELCAHLDEWKELGSGIALQGLMTMAPANDPTTAQKTFEGLASLASRVRDELFLHTTELSMGMSDDYQAAIAAGATIIRLGRVVFDPAYILD